MCGQHSESPCTFVFYRSEISYKSRPSKDFCFAAMTQIQTIGKKIVLNGVHTYGTKREEWKDRKVTNEQVLVRIGEKRTLLKNILRRKANWIGHILRRNCLLHDAIEGQITEVKGVGREEHGS